MKKEVIQVKVLPSETGSVISSHKISNVCQNDDFPKRNVLNMDSINPRLLHVKDMEYAARGPVIQKAMELEKKLQLGAQMEFSKLIKGNLGDAQAMGQKPITFLRQVLAVTCNPQLMNDSHYPNDVKRKAAEILQSCRGSIGCYTESRGIELVRSHVASYIQRRDDHPSSKDDIILCAGASDGIRACLRLFKGGEWGKTGVMIPVPEYPLYSAVLDEFGLNKINYYLDEKNGWEVNVEDLEKNYIEASKCCVPSVLVVINPGNPTGHVLSKRNMEEIVRFCHRYNLLLLADEVYQNNVYGENNFTSFKKIICEIGKPYDEVELISVYSASKGYAGECGLRAGYIEVFNMDAQVKSILIASIAVKLCPSVIGQVVIDCLVDPPKFGDESYPLYQLEKNNILKDLEEKSFIISSKLNEINGISCSNIQGSMYAFPKIEIPNGAVMEASNNGISPDLLYSLSLLEKTGICVVPGSGIGQIQNTYHFRLTILPSKEDVIKMVEEINDFHKYFLELYQNEEDGSVSN